MCMRRKVLNNKQTTSRNIFQQLLQEKINVQLLWEMWQQSVEQVWYRKSSKRRFMFPISIYIPIPSSDKYKKGDQKSNQCLRHHSYISRLAFGQEKEESILMQLWDLVMLPTQWNSHLIQGKISLSVGFPDSSSW